VEGDAGVVRSNVDGVVDVVMRPEGCCDFALGFVSPFGCDECRSKTKLHTLSSFTPRTFEKISIFVDSRLPRTSKRNFGQGARNSFAGGRPNCSAACMLFVAIAKLITTGILLFQASDNFMSARSQTSFITIAFLAVKSVT